MFCFNRYISILFYKHRWCRSYTGLGYKGHFRHYIALRIIPGSIYDVSLIHDMIPFAPTHYMIIMISQHGVALETSTCLIRPFIGFHIIDLCQFTHEPINSTHLVELCKEQLGWSKATTYTVIRRLSERGVVKNENAVVTALVSKEQAQASRLDEMMEETFQGSMPAFIAAFSRSKKLTRDEVAQLKALIDNYEEDRT